VRYIVFLKNRIFFKPKSPFCVVANHVLPDRAT
jgi:hypothetical protein